MIKVFIGTAQKFQRCQPVIEYSIRKNTRQAVDIRFIGPELLNVPPSGCTGFTNMRYAVPELCGFEGFAIYLDVDMLVLGDILSLYSYQQPGKWAQMVDGYNEVSIIDCAAMRGVLPPLWQLHHYRKWEIQSKLNGRTANVIPAQWNVKDHATPDAKLIHFTDLDRQPWFYDNHACQAACDLWFNYEKEAKALPTLEYTA